MTGFCFGIGCEELTPTTLPGSPIGGPGGPRRGVFAINAQLLIDVMHLPIFTEIKACRVNPQRNDEIEFVVSHPDLPHAEIDGPTPRCNPRWRKQDKIVFEGWGAEPQLSLDREPPKANNGALWSPCLRCNTQIHPTSIRQVGGANVCLCDACAYTIGKHEVDN